MKNILITGYNGFVGHNFCRNLKNVKISGIDLVESRLVKYHYAWNNMPINQSFDSIIHLAGKAHDTKDLSAEQEYFDVNVGLSKKIFDLFLTTGTTKFIFFSSVKAVADSVNGAELVEDVQPNPQTPYGKSKLATEEYLKSIPLPEGKSIYILRPCMIHGPGNKGNLNLLYQLQQKGIPWPLGAFENKRSFCSMANVTYVVQQLIEREIEPGIYHLADDEALSTNEIIALIAESQNKKARIWHLPVKLINLLARLGDFLHLPLNSERLKKLTESYLVSNQKLKDALGIERLPVTAIEGLQKTFESFRNKKFDIKKNA